MSMQMDAYLRKEQIGTLFVRVGAPEGGFRGGRGIQPENHTCLYNFFFWSLLGGFTITAVTAEEGFGKLQRNIQTCQWHLLRPNIMRDIRTPGRLPN